MTSGDAVVGSSAPKQIPGVLSIRVLSARALQSAEVFGQVDSYVTLTYGRESFSTQVMPETNDPQYGEEFLSTSGLRPDDVIYLTVWEKYNNADHDEEIGRAIVPLCDVAHGYMEPTYFEIEKDGAPSGELCVCLRFTNLSPALDLSVSRGNQQGLLQQEQQQEEEEGGASSRRTLSLVDGEVELDDDDLIEQAAAYLAGPRTRFLRYGYYYDLSKNVYRRARRLPVISLTAPAYEYMMGGVLTVALGRNQDPVVVLDRLVSGALGQLDEAIDSTKDKALLAAIQLKKKVVELSESLAHGEGLEEGEGQRRPAGGKVAALKRYLSWGATVAKPVVGYVPIVGGVLKRTLEHIVPTPAPTALPPQEQQVVGNGEEEEEEEAAAVNKESVQQQEQGVAPEAVSTGPPTN